MAERLPRELCFTCGKIKGTFTCEGCRQVFCSKHSNEHRQKLHLQLDEVTQEQDRLLQDLMLEKDRHTTSVSRIEIWEQEWIEKVKKIAKIAKEEINNIVKPITQILLEKIPSIREQLVKARQDDDFVEVELADWSKTLKQLRKDTLIYTQTSDELNDPIKKLEHQIFTLFSEISDDRTNRFRGASSFEGQRPFRPPFRGRVRGRPFHGIRNTWQQSLCSFVTELEKESNCTPVFLDQEDLQQPERKARRDSFKTSSTSRSSSINRSSNRLEDFD